MDKAKLFFESTSLRGFGKVIKANNIFLRVLWSAFVVSTSSALFVSIFQAVSTYLQYDLNIQTSLLIDDKTEFPAVTFCNHQPFSKTAYDYWNKNKIISPTNFSRDLRNKSLEYLLQIDPSIPYSIDPKNAENSDKIHNTMLFSMAYDTVNSYYQNLETKIAIEISHQQSQIIHTCMWKYGQSNAFASACIDPAWSVKLYSHPRYFNCFTVQPSLERLENAKEIGILNLIIYLGPSENTDIQYRESFMSDIFEQFYGIRMVIHEPGTFPDIERYGIQIEPGKMNEVSYQPTLKKREETPMKPCVSSTNSLHFFDLNRKFRYDFETCINSEIQALIIAECKCVYSQLPRLITPNRTVPYCGSMLNVTVKRIKERTKCISNLYQKVIPNLKRSLQKWKCLARCTNMEHDIKTSVTKWRYAKWQLHWLNIESKLWENYSTSEKSAERNDLLKNAQKYLGSKNLTKYKEGAQFEFNDRYTFLSVKRRSQNTIVKQESLVLSMNSLFSRIGGLCSLYIGLTLAFFIEVIEFMYVACINPSPNRNNRKSLESKREAPIPLKTNDCRGPQNNQNNHVNSEYFQLLTVDKIEDYSDEVWIKNNLSVT